MHRRFKAPSPALVISLIALFVALGGTGYAASNAVFSAPSKAAIVKIVKGVAPTLNVKSAAGLSTLPSGQSESGLFAGGGSYNSGGWIGVAITYPRPLAAAIVDLNIVDVPGASTTHCPGTGKAAPGYLCLYNGHASSVSGNAFYSSGGSLFPSAMGKLGVVLYWPTTGSDAYVGGSWTVTAP